MFKGGISRNTIGRLTMVALLVAAISPAVARAEVNPWVQSFTPVRELYVSPTGGGNGLSPDSPMSFTQARNSAVAGDLIWMLGGTYNIGTVNLSRAGTGSNPIVYRAMPNQRATIDGAIQMTGAHNWVWGLEFIDSRHLGQTEYSLPSIEARAAGVHIINNIIHHSGGGIGGWNTGPGHVYYGNIIYDIGAGADGQIRTNYPTYTQNNYDTNGYKYFVQNMFFDGRRFDNPYNFHAYTEGGYVSGFHLHQNVFDNGRWLIGGFNVPHHHNTVDENYFYDTTTVQFGYRRPMQFQFTNNYLGRSSLAATWAWGADEQLYQYPDLPTRITGNTIILPPGGVHVRFRTVAFDSDGNRLEGLPRIRPGDIVDGNIYSGFFRGHLEADGKAQSINGLTHWRNASAAAGVMFGENDKEIPVPTTPVYFTSKNEYDDSRGHLVVYNWGIHDNVLVDLLDLVNFGDSFQIHHAKDFFGDPVLAGVYTGDLLLPMAGKEFGAFIVVSQPNTLATPEPGSALLLAGAGLLLLRRRARRSAA